MVLANSADPDQSHQTASYDLGLHVSHYPACKEFILTIITLQVQDIHLPNKHT